MRLWQMHIFSTKCALRSSNLCADLLVLTPRMKNKTSQTEYWCQWSWVQDDLCCICFLIDCLLQLCTMEKGGFIHQPAVMSFYMHTLFGGLGISNELSLRKRHRWSNNHVLLYVWNQRNVEANVRRLEEEEVLKRKVTGICSDSKTFSL